MRVTKVMGRFWKALRISEKLIADTTSKDTSALKGALGANYFENTVLLSADEHDLVGHVKLSAALARDLKKVATFESRAFYSQALVSFPELRCVHSTSCKKHPSCSDAFLLAEIWQTNIYLLLVKNVLERIESSLL